MRRRKALIAGATGAIGSAVARELASTSGWRVVGAARKPPSAPEPSVEYLPLDMRSAPGCASALQAHRDITHLYYCARADHDDLGRESAPANLELLANLLDAVEVAAPDLAHVHVVQGGKVYGVHLGPFPTPAREDDPRNVVANFNYAQEDLLRERTRGAKWSWSASRPNTLVHFTPEIGRNLVSSLGVYAAICRELGAALDFPGPEGAYRSITQVTSTDLLARGIAWMSTEERCANQAFNLTNGDVFRWASIWPRLARAFDLPLGSVRPLKLAEVMADKEPVWRAISEREGLSGRPLAQVSNWAYLDATLERWWDEILSTNKARAHGFGEWADSEAEILAVLARYREAAILP